MKPKIRITIAGGKEAAHLCDALHCLNGSQSEGNIHNVVHVFATNEIATEWDPAPPPPPTPVPVPLGANVLRDGRKARVLCNDAAGAARRVIALIQSKVSPDAEVTSHHYEDGRVNLDGTPSPGDLVGHLPPEPPKPREFWVNRYPSDESTVYESREQADKNAAPSRVECIHVREVLHGEADELESLRRWKADARNLLGRAASTVSFSIRQDLLRLLDR